MPALTVWLRVAVAAGGVTAVALLAAGWGYAKGSATCRLDHAEAALKTEQQTREDNDEIDHKTPRGGGADAQYRWLREAAERFHQAD